MSKSLSFQRSLLFVFQYTVKQIYGSNIIIQFALDGQFYAELPGHVFTEPEVQEIRERMKELTMQDLPFRKKSMRTREAISIFTRQNMPDKAKLFRFRRVSNTILYEMNGYYNYYYGSMVKSTGEVDSFCLTRYENGILVSDQPPWTEEHTKMFDVLKRSYLFSKTLHAKSVGDLNEAIVTKRINDIILMQESVMADQISHIADDIISRGCKLVMLSGPSSSGKTSTSKRLALSLESKGIHAYPISADNFYKERAQIPFEDNGEQNFENLEAIDVELFNEKMTELLRGEAVSLPTYSFKTGKKAYNDPPITLNPHEVLIIEGIHCLNPAFSYSLDPKEMYRMYISALNPISIDNGNRISSSDLRLLRRIARDATHRNTSADETLKMWSKVREGEARNIFPYQENADVIFNSSFVFEVPLIKQAVEPLLFSVPADSEMYEEARRLLKFLDFFLSWNDEYVPNHSILREFIGGSCLNVG